MKIFTFLSALIFTTFSYSQDYAGYYITNSGQRVNGLFKKSYFTDAATLEFRSSAAQEYKKLSPDEMVEYGIGSEYRVVKYTVQIDNSNSTSERKLSTQKSPEWEKKVLFLNILLEGDAALYSYIDNNETKYFYTVKNKIAEPVQLINRKYLSGTAVRSNATFKQDVFLNVSCDGDTTDDFLNLSYTKSGLVAVFKRYNECTGSTYKVYSNKGGTQYKTEFSVFAGANISTFNLKDNGTSDSESKVTPGFGVEAAIIFPSEKWAVFARLEYENMKGMVEKTTNPGFQVITNEYTLKVHYINVALGPRYFLTSKLYTDASVGLHMGFGDLTEQKFTEAGGIESISSIEGHTLALNFFAGVGAGYKITDKWGLEIRYDLPRGILASEIGPDLTTGRMGAMVKYTFN